MTAPIRILRSVDLVVGLRRDMARPAPGEIVLDVRRPPASTDAEALARRAAFTRPFFKAVGGRWIARLARYEVVQRGADPILCGSKAAIRTKNRTILEHMLEVNATIGRTRPVKRWMHDPSRDIWHTIDPHALDHLDRAVQHHH